MLTHYAGIRRCYSSQDAYLEMGRNTAADPAGFSAGVVWHGWVAPISVIVASFEMHIRGLRMWPNTGWWYDLGSYLAVNSAALEAYLLPARDSKSEP